MHAETQEHVCQYNITVSGRCRVAVLCVGIISGAPTLAILFTLVNM